MARKSIRRDEHFIVAIGASAGGLEAIHEFFDHALEGNSVSYVIVQHLSPDYKSLLVELVSRHTNMKVYEAEHNLIIKKNCIYVIPNNKFMTVGGGKLILSEKLPLKVPNNAIDVFMHSLAKDKGSNAIAIILSGTGTDGTKGIATIKEEGGLVIAQEPYSSKFDGMPNSAITSGNVDYILAPSEMPRQIVEYITESQIDEDATIDDEMLQLIFGELKTRAGMDFHYYKTPTITRRVLHRIRKGNFESVERYYEYLRDNVEECKQLGREFLINVTRFFRDNEAFEVLRQEVMPAMLSQKEPGEQVKLWVCACSTGEEAYSLAILLDEVISEQRSNVNVKIFATDIEKSNIEIASRGIYPSTIEADVDPVRLKNYFVKADAYYTIIPRIRKQIVFAQHNVIKDPPFIKNDLVSCRNMLIYMNQALQERVYSVLLFSVNKGGVMFLGSTENPNSIKQHLQEVNGKCKIFRKVSDARLSPYLPEVSDKSREINGRKASIIPTIEKKPRGLWEDFKETLFSEFNFAAFYIDRNFEIKEAVGNFDQILSLPKKILKLNLLRMLPANISNVLITEIKSAWKTNERKIVKNLHFKSSGSDILLQVLIKPEPESFSKAHTLVAFHFMQVDDAMVTEQVRLVYPDPQQNEYVLSLEEELNETKSHLQHAIEDLETANEELQSSNEELLSANEELQSSNEELQSLNEELHTLNTEHQIKIKELIELNDDLNNYFRSSNIGQIFLDKNLAIRKFNPAAMRMINFIEGDVGRPINHISTNLRYHGLINDIERVLQSHDVVEKEVQLMTGKNLLLRIIPYITQEQRSSGVVISFFDITTITNLNNIIRGVFNSSHSAILALEAIRDNKKQIGDFSILAANHAAARLLKKEPDNLKALLLKKNIHLPFLDGLHHQFVSVVEDDKPLHTDVYFESEKIWFEVTAVKMMDGVAATLTDITQKKNAEDRLKRNYVELVSTKETLKKLNNDLEQKVSERTQALTASEERFRLVSQATNDAIWDWDLVNNTMWFSDAFFHKFGYHTEDKSSRKLWLSKLHEDDQRMVEKSIYDTINNSKKQWTKEYRFLKSNGEYANILDRGYVMQDEYGTPYRMVGSMLDLTELKKAEREAEASNAQRQFLAESIPLCLWTATANGAVDFVNPQFEQYTGLTSPNALGEGWKQIVHNDDLVKLENHGRQSTDSPKDFQLEIRIRCADNSYRWNILAVKARKDDGGVLGGWLFTATDIHEQKQLHSVLEQKVDDRTRQLLLMNKALEISNNDLQQFASVASHDLQEPLRKIHMYSDMLQNRYGDVLGQGGSYLKKILQSSSRMKSIINNVLSYSKLSAENVGFEPTDINKVIQDILVDLEVAIEEKKAIVKIDNFPAIDTIRGQITQVFQNMIGNALKFSKPGVPPEIHISCELLNEKSLDAPASTAGDFCRITLRDNGIGFNMKASDNIFVLFHRLHSKDTFEGTGIGLAIAKKIIEKHNGLISASGEEGVGATFTMVLPVRQKL